MVKRKRDDEFTRTKKISNLRCPYCGLGGVDVTISADGTLHVKCSFCQEEHTFTARRRSDGKTMKITDNDYLD